MMAVCQNVSGRRRNKITSHVCGGRILDEDACVPLAIIADGGIRFWCPGFQGFIRIIWLGTKPPQPKTPSILRHFENGPRIE